MVLPERPDEQPDLVVTAMQRLTGLDEVFVRQHLAVMSAADATFAWERIRAHEHATGTRISRPEHLPEALVREINEFTGVDDNVIRDYLAVRHVMDTIGAWERLAPPTPASARLQHWRARLAYGRPLPPWAQALIDEIGVNDSQRERATHLMAATIAFVGGGQADVRTWLAQPHPETNRTPMEIAREDGWEGLDSLLLNAFEHQVASRTTWMTKPRES